VLKAEKVDGLKDSENQRALSEEKASRWGIYIFLVSFLGMAALFLWSSFTWPVMAYLATTLAGTVVGYLLVSKDVGVTYDVVESFCNTGKRTNCDRILQSDEATLFGHISLSDAVLSYFSTQLIAAFLLIPVAGEAASLWWTLAAIGVLTLPVVAYSLWLQAVTFKTWCRLCLLVAGVLVIQAGLYWWLAAAGVYGLADGSLWIAGLITTLFLVTGSLVYLLKNRLKEGAEAQLAEVVANRIKYNASVFTNLLLQQPKANCSPFEHELIIGNPNAPIQITMAASLVCGPCKNGFEKAKQLIAIFPDIVNLAVRLSVSKNGNGQESDPGRYLLEYWLKSVDDKEEQAVDTEKLLQDWFELADLNRFRDKYPFHDNGESKELSTLTVQISNWFKKAGIKGTPTFFINGYKLPEHYRVEDLQYLVTGFSEHIISANKEIQKMEID
jgi:hypothetical protein